MNRSKNILRMMLLLVPALAFAEEEKPIHITMDPAIHYQTIDDFGASDAWRCQFVSKHWPLEKRNVIAGGEKRGQEPFAPSGPDQPPVGVRCFAKKGSCPLFLPSILYNPIEC